MSEKTKREKADIEETQEEGGLSDDQLEAAAGGKEVAKSTPGAVRYEKKDANIFSDGFESGDTSK